MKSALKNLFYLSLIGGLIFLAGCSTFRGKSHQAIKIMDEGKAKPSSMARYLRKNNPEISRKEAKQFAQIYITESNTEGVNHDVAFVQMCHETNFLRYGGQVAEGQNNFAGIGATDDGARGASFETKAVGVRAQVQHLKAYASKKPLKRKTVDPRFHLVKRGTAKTIHDLTGKWASDPAYGYKLEEKIKALRKH